MELNTTNYVILGIIHILGTLLCIAAFGKHFKATKSYHDDEDMFMAIMGSFTLWPICLLVLACLAVYRKTYR